jgi:hypothetical protein
LIVGDTSDPHVRAVVSACEAAALVIAANSLRSYQFSLADGAFDLYTGDSHWRICENSPAKGWLRRLAAPGWEQGMVVESRRAAELASWMSLLVGVIRTLNVQWLTGLDALYRAENKLVQYAAARRAGVSIPSTCVSNAPATVIQTIGAEIVLKPLGPGHFVEKGDPYIVPATAVTGSTPYMRALSGAPFLAQQRLKARRHLRVVTVGGGSWCAALDAEDLPLDWRLDDAAHRSFIAVPSLGGLHDDAIAIARALDLGYSSQDWVETDDGVHLLDVNPAGQWLFLPPEVSNPVTRAIGAWLDGSG